MPGDEDYSLLERLSRWQRPEMDEEASDLFVLAADILHGSAIDGACVEIEAESDMERDQR